MTHAYSELYIDDAMACLGEMLDYALCDLKIAPDEFWDWFLASGLAESFGSGNPKYVSGMSGAELAREVLYRVKGTQIEIAPEQPLFHTPEYWAGWSMAYYQWYRNISFEKMAENGLTVSKVLSMYILHEADISKFVEEADAVIDHGKIGKASNLSQIRKASGMTQKALADASGVSLRMIQLYEQRQNDISAAQFSTVVSLARALGCSPEALME